MLIDQIPILNEETNEPVLDEETGEATFTERPSVFVGQQGMSLRRFNNGDWHKTWNWKSRMDDPNEYTDFLAMHSEGMEMAGSRMASLYRAWFTAP